MDQAKDRDEASDVTQAQEPVQLDFYGVKVRLTPSSVPKDMPDPGSWLEVAKRVHQDLKAIAGGLIRLVRVTVESATNLVAGIGALPQAFTRKVEKAHAKGDDVEAAKQASPVESSALAAADKIRHLLNRKALGGNSVGIAIDETDSVIVLYALKAGAEESLPQLMKVIGGTLSETGGLVSRKNQEPGVWISMNEDFQKLVASLEGLGESEVANALRFTKLSMTGTHLIISGDVQALERLRGLLENRTKGENFQAALVYTFHHAVTWSFLRE